MLFFLPLLASLVVQTVKHLPEIQETWVQSLGQEDPLKKEMTTHSSTLAWKIPGRLQSMRLKESDTTEWLHFLLSLTSNYRKRNLVHLSSKTLYVLTEEAHFSYHRCWYWAMFSGGCQSPVFSALSSTWHSWLPLPAFSFLSVFKYLASPACLYHSTPW